MRPSEALQFYRADIRRIVKQHHGNSVRVFGSVLHGQDTENSDLDLLIEPTPDITLMDIAAIRYELHELLKISVDVLTPGALPDSFKDKILAEAVVV